MHMESVAARRASLAHGPRVQPGGRSARRSGDTVAALAQAVPDSPPVQRLTALRTLAEARTPRPPETNRAAPVQRIQSVAAFRAATPASGLSSRNTVGQIDTDLAAYIANKTPAMATTLINRLNGYIPGNHKANRIAAATALRTEAMRERALLNANVPGYMVDALVAQVGAANIASLIALAPQIAPAHIMTLPNLIQTVGAANLGNGDLHGLIAAAGPAHHGLLPAMITSSGGVAQLPTLHAIVNRHPGAGNLATDLATAAGGNGARFAELAAAVPMFQAQAAPAAVPANVNLAVAAYNTARDAATNGAIGAAMTQIAAQTLVAHTEATNFNAVLLAAAHPQVAGGLLNNVMTRYNNLQPRAAAVAGGGAIAANDPALADSAATLVTGALANQVNARAAANPPAIPAAVPVPGAFTTAVGQVDTAKTNLTASQSIPQIGTVNWPHFLVRHTPHHFDFGDVKADNTQWVPAWGANAAANVAAQLVHVLNALAAAQTWLMPGVPRPGQNVPQGGTAQIAGLAEAAGPPPLLRLGQFFPENGNGNVPFSAFEMRAIQNVR